MALHVLAYNLTRVMNIVGIKPLIAVKSHPSATPFSRPRMTPLTEPRPAARSPT